jgi:catechol 2,3-dioxygenase-like lactoylglutathione lyase family enzyme
MKLTFFYLPVADLKEALALYRDTLGWQEAWREGDTTTSLRLPGPRSS